MDFENELEELFIRKGEPCSRLVPGSRALRKDGSGCKTLRRRTAVGKLAKAQSTVRAGLIGEQPSTATRRLDNNDCTPC